MPLSKAKMQVLRALDAAGGRLSATHPLFRDSAAVQSLQTSGLIDPVLEDVGAVRLARYALTATGRAMVGSWRRADKTWDVWLVLPQDGEVGLTVWAPDLLGALRVALGAVGMDAGPNAKVPRCRADQADRWPVDGWRPAADPTGGTR